MKKILWCDVETTGLDCNRNGIVQIAFLMDIGGIVVDSLVCNVQPFDEDMTGFTLQDDGPELNYNEVKQNIETMGELRLPASNIKVSQLLTHITPKEAYGRITAFLNKYIDKYDKLDKAWFGGYNSQFDLNFVKRFFIKNGDEYLGSYINWRVLDPMYILYNKDYRAEPGERLDSMKLKDVCIHYELEHIPHDPMSDIKATRKLWYILLPIRKAM